MSSVGRNQPLAAVVQSRFKSDGEEALEPRLCAGGRAKPRCAGAGNLKAENPLDQQNREAYMSDRAHSCLVPSETRRRELQAGTR